jgi:hypothetical protein
MAQGGKQVKPWSWDMESGGESVVAVVKELACEIGDSLRNGGKQSWVERTQDVVRAKGPRLNKAIGHASGNVMIWMNQGGFWRKLLVSSVSFFVLFSHFLSEMCIYDTCSTDARISVFRVFSPTKMQP